MNLIHWHPSIRTILAGMLIAGSFAGVQARKGYLPRLSKRSSKPAATKPAEAKKAKGHQLDGHIPCVNHSEILIGQPVNVQYKHANANAPARVIKAITYVGRVLRVPVSMYRKTHCRSSGTSIYLLESVERTSWNHSHQTQGWGS